MKGKRSAPKKTKPARTITLDRLAEMTQGGFLDLGKRIDSVEERLTARIDDVEELLTARIDGVEQKVNALRSELQVMYFDHKKMQARVENIEIKLFGSIQE